jgi:hypothetical protein
MFPLGKLEFKTPEVKVMALNPIESTELLKIMLPEFTVLIEVSTTTS